MAIVAEILDWVAKTCWQATHDGAECPPHAIPTEAELAHWLAECPQEVWAEGRRLLSDVTGREMAWWESPPDAKPMLICFVSDVVETEPALPDEEPQWEHLSAIGYPLNKIHDMWLEYTENGKELEHPLNPLMRSWQQRPVPVTPNRRNDPLMAVIRPIKVAVSLERETAQLMLGIVHHGTEEKAMPLLPDVPDVLDQARSVPLLALADASGTPSMAQGRGAPLDLRLVVETTLSIDTDDRVLPAVALPFTVEELRDALFPNGWRVGRDWPRMRDALLRAHTRSIPIDSRGSRWFPLAIRQLPSETNMRLSDLIIMEVALPPGSKTGPVINRRELRQLGVTSSPMYRSYIAVHSLAWNPGVTRIVNPKTRKRGWAGNPDAYPVLTLHDRRMIAFGPADTKHRSRKEIDAAFTDLPGTVVIDKNAVDRKTGTKGWRVLPMEAGNAVRAWINTKEETLPNRGKPKR